LAGTEAELGNTPTPLGVGVTKITAVPDLLGSLTEAAEIRNPGAK
jgi:hypothetical protein